MIDWISTRRRSRRRHLSWRGLAWRWCLYAGLTVFLVSLLLVLPLRWIEPPKSAFMLGYQEQLGQSLTHSWVDLEAMSSALPLAVVASEDQKFFRHRGFDFASISKALQEDRGRGASTITQQTVKNIFLWPDQSWLRKGLEAWLTIFAEALWSKRRTLELYLNFAEFGPGIYGADAASRAYYNRAPSELTSYQAAQLAAVLPSPRRMSPTRPTPYLRQRTREILLQMDLMGSLPIQPAR